jgi:hypothetical protein
MLFFEYTKKSKENKFRQENVRIFRTHLCTHHSLFLVLCSRTMVVVLASAVDRHIFDADPDPNFNIDADPDPDPDWHQNNADPHTDPTLSFTHI